MQKQYNLAYIDGQNLHLWTKSNWRCVDFFKFRIYLRDKYQVQEAYYFLWFVSEDEQELYNSLQKAWFIVIFREHSSTLKWKKKWNVDVDIVFEIMKRVSEKKDFDSIVLVSGDGDYIKLVRWLTQKQILKKILFPNERYSSLYKKLKYTYWVNLSLADIKKKIIFKYKKRAS